MVELKQCFASLEKSIEQVTPEEIVNDFAITEEVDSIRKNLRVRMDEKIKTIVSPIARKHQFNVSNSYDLGYFDFSANDSSVCFSVLPELQHVFLELRLNFPPSYRANVLYTADGKIFEEAEKRLDPSQDLQVDNLEKIFREFVGIKNKAMADLEKRKYTPQQIQSLLEDMERRVQPKLNYPQFTSVDYIIGKGFAKSLHGTSTGDGEKTCMRMYDPTQVYREEEILIKVICG
jgi:type I restriction-modification system DNA methylase subunit